MSRERAENKRHRNNRILFGVGLFSREKATPILPHQCFYHRTRSSAELLILATTANTATIHVNAILAAK